MSSQIQDYRLVTLNDRVVPGFAGIMRESLREKNSSDRELKVVVASSSRVSEGKAIKLAKKITKHVRISRGWSFVSASVEAMDASSLPPLGTPQQTERRFTAWIVE
jgi:predicted dinucleotide-binding enzyme